mgnify:FL=1|jgi:hypothetical protein
MQSTETNWNQERVTWVTGNDLQWREVLTRLRALQALRGQARYSRENLFAVVRFCMGEEREIWRGEMGEASARILLWAAD